MNETNNHEASANPTIENNFVPNANEAAETKPDENGADNPTELTLEERERRLEEREKALERSERRLKAKELIRSKELPDELSDFVDCENDESMVQSIDKLAEILENHSRNHHVTIVDSGITHGFDTGSFKDDFVKGLTDSGYRR